MDLSRVLPIFEAPTQATIQALLNDRALVFWIDWRQEDETIAESCEAVLHTGQLSGELVEADSEDGYEVYLRYGEKREKVPLQYDCGDRHLTLCALNRVLAPDYEVRFCIDSNEGDTLAFLPMKTGQWLAIEQQYGDAVARRFYKISEKPNLFTDHVPF